jgi:predicted NBD/HSP70 family sugar kinase
MRAVRDDTARWLAIGCQICQQLFAPECIVFGGGVMQDGGRLIQCIREWYQRLAGSKHPDIESFIRPAAESEHAGILGAAALVLRPET